MGGSSSQQQTQGTSAPWAPQQGYLTNLFKAAQGQYNTNMATGPYSGNYVAAPSQTQYDAYGNAVSQAGADQTANNGIMSQGQDLANTGAAGATSALGNLQSYAGTDQTGNNIAHAQQYAAGEDIPGMVRAGMQNADQNASENQIPNLYRAAAASGGLNSSSAALGQGVIQRGLDQQAQDLTAQYSNQAYQNGLSNANTNNAYGLQADSQLGSLGAGLQGQGTNQQTTAINNQGAINNQAVSGANGATGLDQQTLNNLLAKYTGNINFGTGQLAALKNSIGGSYGSQTTGSQNTQTDPSLMSTIGSLLGGVVGLLPK